MNQMSLEQELRSNSHPGWGIVIGHSDDGTKVVTVCFIMGRGANSRNRVFVVDGERIRTQAFDPVRLEDPSLIIYAPVRVLGNKTIVTNGNQIDTICDRMDHQMAFKQFLRRGEFEPDTPNYTPRVSGVLHIGNNNYNYTISILKSDNTGPGSYLRSTYAYQSPAAGEGRFIHTYMHDDNPLPSFEGEPKKVGISGGINTFTDLVWSSLNEDSETSLFVRYIDIAADTCETRIVNKNR